MTWLVPFRITDAQPLFRSRALLPVLCGVALALLALGARADSEGPNAPNPENVLTKNPILEHFERMLQPASAMAAPRYAERRKRTRGARTAAKQRQAVSELPHVPVRIDQPFWPNTLASPVIGVAAPAKTAQDTKAEEPEAQVVFANELSDLDLAAKPIAASEAATDGRAQPDASAPESQESLSIHTSRFAPVIEAARGLAHSAWMEPILMVLTVAFAALCALRLFAFRPR